MTLKMNIYNEITLCVYPSIQETADLIGDASTAEDKKAEPELLRTGTGWDRTGTGCSFKKKSARHPHGKPLISGRSATGFIAIRDDLINAGAYWFDLPVVVDENIVTSRTPQVCACACVCVGA